MIDKYKEQFEMHQRVKGGENPSLVVANYIPLFEKEGVGQLALVDYFVKYVKNIK